MHDQVARRGVAGPVPCPQPANWAYPTTVAPRRAPEPLPQEDRGHVALVFTPGVSSFPRYTNPNETKPEGQIAFDATSAYVHAENSRKLNELGVLMIDLTPAAIGPYCVPPVNLKTHVGTRARSNGGCAAR